LALTTDVHSPVLFEPHNEYTW